MGRLTLILGGARSGKSAMAERLARQSTGRVTFIATAQPLDEEMQARIAAHRAARPAHWRTLEESLDLAGAVRSAAESSDLLVVDCLTLWVSNRLCGIGVPDLAPPVGPSGSGGTLALPLRPPEDLNRLAGGLEAAVGEVVKSVRARDVTAILVSNEVGLGLVPDTPMGRVYRDLLGTVNRRFAEDADEVVLMVAGLPLAVKGVNVPTGTFTGRGPVDG